MSSTRVCSLLLLPAALSAAAVVVSASGPLFWTVATAADFLRGTSDGVYVSLEGVVTAGPQVTSRLASAPPQIWSLAEGPDGTLWAGTGGDGRLLRLRQGQNEETAFDADESNIFAIAVAGQRTYAASSPDGRVYVIDGAAPARPFFDPQEKYIWALATDAAGRLWVGAGNPAVIYRVDAAGTGQAVYRPPATHVVSLMRDAEGRMLAGTDSPGRLYRLGGDDRPFVLLDSGLTELRSTAVGPGGVVFAAAVARGDDPAPGGESASVAIAAAAPPSPTATTPPAAPARRSVLYRIDPAGTWESIWETADAIYDIAAADDGAVLAATGPEGRLYRIERSRDVLLLTGVDARQITRFAGPAPSGARMPAFATANPGRVFSPGAGDQYPATYISSVRDSKSVATWGHARWEATGAVALFTRSGNTDKPDDSWSDWSAPYSRKEGEPITSPAARYLQWRAVLTRPRGSPQPQLTSVTVAYLPRNNRPAIASLTVHPPGVVFQRPFSSEDGAIAGLDDVTAEARRPPGDTGAPAPPPGRRMFQKGLQTIVWKAEDADGDSLSYTVQYRREGEQAWRELRARLTDSIFVWDTTTVPDGRYLLRLIASDAPANAADRALTGDRESDPVEVDNTPPTITTDVVRQGNTARLVVRVRDGHSPIQKVEYSVDGGPWQLVFPADGLADSPDERYELPLGSEAEAKRIMIRAVDVLQNVTSQAGG
jgi:sugar lactone lactonase YvrE